MSYKYSIIRVRNTFNYIKGENNMKLSICMMIKNEEKNLVRCLDKLKPLVDEGLAELIIVDTGSEDNSVNIAKQYTDRVYFHKWNKNFSEMRNKSISYAEGEWLLLIDADERLDDVDELIELLHSNELDNYVEYDKLIFNEFFKDYE